MSPNVIVIKIISIGDIASVINNILYGKKIIKGLNGLDGK